MGGNPTTTSIYHELVLIAYCIDTLHGGVYAWAYLSAAGLADADILRILANRPAEVLGSVDDIQAKARAAMRIIGMQHALQRREHEC
jgi:hypothetical protein